MAFPDIAARGRIEFLEDTLRRSILRYEAVQNARLDARQAFEQAKQALNALDAEVESLDASMAGLRADISARRLNASQDAQKDRARQILARFPHELLRGIFLQAAQEVEIDWPDNEDWGYDFYDSRSRLPFDLASVCRKWRTVALQTTALWTFVGVGPLDGYNSGRDVAYVKLLLARSRKRPIDVILDWSGYIWSASTQYAVILDAVGRHTQRWRRVSISFPVGTPGQALRVLRLPMPALEGLCLFRDESEDMVSTTTRSTYLPFCPSLRRLSNDVLFVVPLGPLAHLTDFSVSVDASPSCDVWRLLQALPAVQRLCLFFEDGNEDAPSDVSLAPLTLAHVRRLDLTGRCERFSPWVNLLEMPDLLELTIDASVIDPFASLFDKVAETLRALTLRLVSEDTPLPAAHIAKLDGLCVFVLLGCTALSDEFYTALASRETLGLEFLFRVVIDRPKLDEDGAANVSALMQRLHASAASAGDGAVEFKLSLEHDEDVPDWLLRQYKFTIGEGGASASEGEAVES